MNTKKIQFFAVKYQEGQERRRGHMYQFHKIKIRHCNIISKICFKKLFFIFLTWKTQPDKATPRPSVLFFFESCQKVGFKLDLSVNVKIFPFLHNRRRVCSVMQSDGNSL